MIKIEKFSFPVDFMVLDVDENPKIPFILGIPFIKSARMMVDTDKGHVKVRT